MPPDLKLEKNEGPACRPMKKMKSIRPKSRRKVKTCGSIAMPKCPAASPTKSTNVTPRETPKTFILPSASPTEMTSAYTKTMCAIDVGEVRTDSMMAGAAQVLREGKPWTL